MTISKNIFFYWNDVYVPSAVLKNVQDYKSSLPEFNVYLFHDDDILKFESKHPEILFLFKKATIPSLKADIARIILLYEYGGVWIDTNTRLTNPEYFKKILEKSASCEFVFTIMPSKDYNLMAGFLISRQYSRISKKILELILAKLSAHHEREVLADNYIPYNFYPWVAPVVIQNFLDYPSTVDMRKKACSSIHQEPLITPNLQNFQEYCCGVICVDFFLQFYGTNMDHHHGNNFANHWSNLQKKQKLFLK